MQVPGRITSVSRILVVAMASLSWLDWSIFVAYLLVIFWIGLRFAGQQHSNEDYFVGGRNMHWVAVAFSIFAGGFSSLSFVGLPREAAYDDYHLYLAILCVPLVVTPIVAYVFVPMYHRLKITSAYEYVERRFDRSLRRLCSALWLATEIGWMGNLLFAVGLIVQVVLGLSDSQLTLALVMVGLFATLYTAVGGVKAVIWTDVLQTVTLGLGMLAVLLLTVTKIEGGWSTFFQVAIEHEKFSMFDFHFDLAERANFYSACAFGMFVYLAIFTVTLTSVQRYVTVPTVSAARRCIFFKAGLSTVIALIFFLVGTSLFVFYHQPGGAGEFPSLSREDQLLTHFVLTEIPYFGLPGLLVAGLFAAAMSSIDTGINSMTMCIVCDWMSNRRLGVGFSRVLSLGFGVLTIAISLLIPYFNANVFDIIITITGTFLGLILGLFVLGMLSKRANTAGAWIGFVAGATSLIAVYMISEVWAWQKVSHWWYGFVTSVPTLSIGLLASRFFPPPGEKQIDGLIVR